MHESFILRDSVGSQVEVIPSRGAWVTRFCSGGEEVLVVDKAAQADPTAKLRGGIPLLFPIAGKLPSDSFVHAGKAYNMPQHGFARARAWRVSDVAEQQLRCRLDADEATLAMFPWRFEAEFVASLRDGSLSIALSATNRDRTPMPFHAGFHPYFSIPRAAKSEARIETDARHAFDNLTGLRGAITKIDWNELDLHLEDHTGQSTRLHRGPGLRSIDLQWSGARRVVLWSQRHGDFLCVEPWTAAGGALASADPLLPWIEPGATATLSLSIGLGAR